MASHATAAVRPCSHQDGIVEDLLPVLRALADPARLRILEMLREREQCVCHLTDALGLSQGTVSHHMGVLKKVGLVLDRRDEADGRWIYYRLAPSAERVGRRLAELLDATQIDPTPADCAGRTNTASGKRLPRLSKVRNSRNRTNVTRGGA